MKEEEAGVGWVLFAGIMILIAGTLNVIWGIAAISESRFLTSSTTYILSGLNTWGWIILIIGVAQFIAAFSIWAGGEFGRWFGIFTSAVNSIAALMSISAYPLWGIVVFGVDLLVIYGLAAYGGRPLEG
jgi:hypothetical protein